MELFQHKVNWFDSNLLYLIEKKQKNEEVISIIVKNNLCNAVDRSNNTLLHVAAGLSNVEVAKYLIDSGSILNASNDLGQTPLMLAAKSNCEAIVKILIEAGAVIRLLDPPNKQEDHLDHLGSDILNFQQECTKIFKKYLPRDNVEMANKVIENGWTQQHAILLGNVDVTKLIMDNKYSSSINEKNQLGVTALDIATFFCDIENVKLLLNHNATVNVENSLYFMYDYKRSLELAEEKLQILKILLNRVDKSTVYHNRERYDYLIYRIFASNDKEIIKLMLQHKRLFLDKFMDTVLCAMASNKIPGVIKLLQGVRFNVNTRKNRDKETPLIVAAQHGNVNAMEYLLDAGADIETVNFLGFSALFMAVNGFFAYEGEPEQCVQLLLERGANAQSVNMNRALPTIIDAILEYQTFETMGDVVLAHLALQQRLGTPVNEVISSKINSHNILKTSFELSKKLLSVKIFQSTTLFDLLTESERKLERHVCNLEFVSKLQYFSEQIEKSYYFNNLLLKRLKIANLMVKMRKQAAPLICRLIDIEYSRFPAIADDIVSYWESQDIKNLIDALS